MITTAVILVGGKGTRLKSKFPDIIKPLTPIGGRPFLDHLLTKLENEGFAKVILLSGDRSEQIEAFLKNRPRSTLEIVNSVEPTPRGTAGALKFAEPVLRAENAFIVLNGDTFFEGSIKLISNAKVNVEKPVAIGVIEVSEATRYGTVELDHQDQVIDFLEKGNKGRRFVNCGLLAVHASVLDTIPKEQNCSLETQILPRIPNMTAIRLQGAFFDIGLPSSYAAFNADVCLREAQKLNPAAGLLLDMKLRGGRMVGPLDAASDRDTLVLQSPSVTELAELNRKSNAQILVIDPPSNASDLYDAAVTKSEYEQVLKYVDSEWPKLQHSVSDYSPFDGELKPALFLDRDGVIIEHVHHISKAQDVKLREGVASLLRTANQKGWLTVVITNQSGLGREVFGWSDYLEVSQRMKQLLAAEGVFVDAVDSAPYFSESQRAKGLTHRKRRKPRPGMIQSACNNLPIDVSRSILIGDRASDLMAGAIAGVGKLCLVQSPTSVAELKTWQDWSLQTFYAKQNEIYNLSDFTELTAFI